MTRIPGPPLTMECRIREGISRSEVKVAISRMEKGKTTGMDGIPVKVWKCLGEEGRTDLTWDLMPRIYEQGKIPTEWIDSVIYLFIKRIETYRIVVIAGV